MYNDEKGLFMDTEVTKKFMRITQKYSPKCFINHNLEAIVEPGHNIYFRLEDVETELDLQCKIIAWLSRPSCKGVSLYWQKRIRALVNECLKTNFSHEEMEEIYKHLGNDLDRDKTIHFIKSGYDLSVISNSEQSNDTKKEALTAKTFSEHPPVDRMEMMKEWHEMTKEIERLQKIESENKIYTEGLLRLYKNLCVGGRYDKRMPSLTAYNIILDIEKIAKRDSDLKEKIEHFLENDA